MSVTDPVLDAVTARANAGVPVVVGIAGAVAVGKTTIAEAIAEALTSRRLSVRVLSTDAFLLPNAQLAARDLIMRKGFPETYDAAALADVLTRLKNRRSASVPTYSHAVYDILADVTQDIEPADVIVIEGVIALQSAVVEHLDVAIYIDADENSVREWFVERFLRLTAAAREDPASFYHRFAALDADQVRQLAEATWDGINGVNLREHIAPSIRNAHLVIKKAADHAIVQVTTVER